MNIKPPSHASDNTLSLILVGALFVFGLCGRGLIDVLYVFVLPLEAEFGWSRSDVLGIYSIAMLCIGLGSPLAGQLFDRWGPRRLWALGIALMISGIFLTGFVERLIVFYLTFGFLLGIASASLGNVPNAALLSRWFTSRLGSAIGFVYSSMGVGVLLLVPLAQALVDYGGWRFAAQVLAGILLAVTLPLFLALPWKRLRAGHPDYQLQRRDPAAPSVDANSIKGAMKTAAFWGFCWVFFVTAIGIFSVAPQLIAYFVEDIGFGKLSAASAYGITGALTPIGMLTFGWLADRLNRRIAAAITYVLTLAAYGFFLLLQEIPSYVVLYAGILCLGLSMGSRGPLVSTLAARLFAGDRFGSIYGVIAMSGGVGSACGAFIGGFIFEHTGSYTAVLSCGLVSIALGSLPFFVVPAMARSSRSQNREAAARAADPQGAKHHAGST